jgi:hypothetical protein
MKQRTRAGFSAWPACTAHTRPAAQCCVAYGGPVAQDNGTARQSSSPCHGQRAQAWRSPSRDTRARDAGAGPWLMAAFGTAARLRHVDGEATTKHNGEVLTDDI